MKITQRNGYILGVFGLAAVLVSAIAMAGNENMTENRKDIVDTAIASKNFTTLLAAVKQAGLVDTLKGAGPFTLFAPTDNAFAKIPEKQLKGLLNDKAALTSVLTYHVLGNSVYADEVVTMKKAKTLQGQSLSIDTSDGVRVDNANVIMTDIVASNGVIHVIDTVVIPN
jgi:uncharacterized surface protein with fasciclin (FAS1) repeats